MTTLFLSLLNMSVTASVTAMAVMLARAAFRKLPRRLTCALWALVGLRLALPFSLESAWSLIPRASTVRETVSQTVPALTGTAQTAQNTGGTDYFVASNFAPAAAAETVPAASFDWLKLFTAVWLAGAAVMVGYLIISAVLLKRRVGACVETEPGVFVADGLVSPFVLGVFRPKIFLPPSLDRTQREMVLAHERAHLQRRDHLIKPFAFLLLSVYWFNPVLWIAYALLCRDIELACDERVIRDMDREDRAFYSQRLLDCGAGHRRIAACPVAFGEVGVKERVKNVLNYKKPAFWIILIAVIAGIVLAVCFLTNPKTEQPDDAADSATMTDGVKDALLDARIFAALQEQSSGSYLEGEYYAEAHHIYGTEEQDGKTAVYTMVRECWFGFVNDYFTEVSGGQYPAVFTFDGVDCKIERAQDGGMFADSVKELFPKKHANAIIKHGDRYDEKLWNELVRQAKDYLKSIGRTATVCPISEAGLSTLSAHGVSAEVSNKLTENPLFDRYPFYGTKEIIENGIRYQYGTGCDMEKNRITFEKYVYGEDGNLNPVEQIIVDAATGEILSSNSWPVTQVEDTQTDFDWSEAAKIDERTIDIDNDGVEDRCVISDGPTSGLFTFYLTVTPVGASEPRYQNIFWTDWSDLSFVEVKKDMELYVRARNPLSPNQEKLYHVLIENGELTLRSEDGDMDRWAGETQVNGQEKLKQQYPELFELDTSKGLDVYIWMPGGKSFSCWLTEHDAYAADDPLLIPDVLAHFNDLTPENVKTILNYYGIDAEKVSVIPYQHPLSSYLWVEDGKIIDGSVTEKDLREMLGL